MTVRWRKYGRTEKAGSSPDDRILGPNVGPAVLAAYAQADNFFFFFFVVSAAYAEGRRSGPPGNPAACTARPGERAIMAPSVSCPPIYLLDGVKGFRRRYRQTRAGSSRAEWGRIFVEAQAETRRWLDDGWCPPRWSRQPLALAVQLCCLAE